MPHTCDSPLVSIITPTYNHESYISECIQSVVRQTYGNWEQIIIDDGSTDETARIIRGYRDARIRYFYQDNVGIEGIAHTYNRALQHCRGTIIAILEGDDSWPAGKLATMVAAFSSPAVVLSYGEMREIDSRGFVANRMGRLASERRRLSLTTLNNSPTGSAVAYMLTLNGHSLIPASTVLIRRSALEEIEGFQHVPGQCYTDFPTFIRLACKGEFRYFADVMGYRRIHSVSATAQKSEIMMTRAMAHLSKLLADPVYQLTDQERRQVDESWRPATAATRFRYGRLLLLERKWSDARSRFRGAIQAFDMRLSVGSIIGWCLSWFHQDMEALFRRTGRPTLRLDDEPVSRYET